MEASLDTGVLSLYVEFCLQAPGSCTNTHLIRQSYLSCWDIGEMGKLVARTQNPAPNPALCRATYHPRRLPRRCMSREKARERSHSRLWLQTSMLAPEELDWTTRKSPFNRAGSSQGSGAKAIPAASSLWPPRPHLTLGSYHSTGEEKRS